MDQFGASGQKSDAELIEESLREPHRFTAVFERHFSAIHRYLARRVGSGPADDLAADVFVVAFQRRGSFQRGAADARPGSMGSRPTCCVATTVPSSVGSAPLRCSDRASTQRRSTRRSMTSGNVLASLMRSRCWTLNNVTRCSFMCGVG